MTYVWLRSVCEVINDRENTEGQLQLFWIQIEVMHEASQGGSSHVLLSSETEESLSNRRR